MPFPQASIDRAKEIAHYYKQRSRDKVGVASRLFNLHFFQTNYGFSDAIQQGRTGHYLHELAYDSDCFSMAGMLYCIAKEAKLQPKIYMAQNMKSLREYEKREEKDTTDHAFITIKINGKEHVIDPYYNTAGLVRFNGNDMVVTDFDDSDRAEEVVRESDFLRELAEEEYLAMLEENRSPQGGKQTLAAGQSVVSGKYRIFLEYNDEARTLHSSYISGGDHGYIESKCLSKTVVWDLEAPVLQDGTWDYTHGHFNYSNCINSGWKREDDILPHHKIQLPFALVQGFMKTFQDISTKQGYTSSIHKIKPRLLGERLEKVGMDQQGNLPPNAGQDPVFYKELLAQLDEIIRNRAPEPKEVQPHDDVSAYYRHLRQEKGLKYKDTLMSQEELDAFTWRMVEHTKEQWIQPVMANLENLLLADLGLKNNRKQHAKNFRLAKNKKTAATHFQDVAQLRKKVPSNYNRLVDYDQFKKEHFGKTLPVSEQMLLDDMRDRVIGALQNFIGAYHPIQVKPFRKGLKKILVR